MRQHLARAARGLRQHAAHRRAVRGVLHRDGGPLHAAVPLPAGGVGAVAVRQGGRGRPAPPLPGRRARQRARAGSLRDRGHLQQGLRRLLPGRRRLHQLGQVAGHPGRPRPWLRCRRHHGVRDGHHRPRPDPARPDLRAVPQPRAHVDARLRRRLRRAPTRRGHPLRHRHLRRRPGRADRHLRHHQGQAGHEGLGPRPRLPLRARRPAHQADAAGGHGQGHPARRDLRPEAQALLRGGGVPRPLRVRPRRQAGHRHRARAGEPQAPVGRARGRRHHVQRAAARRDPDHEARAGRAGHHAVRLPELRDARPGQDGLPGPAQPHDPRRRAAQHRGQPR